jgi:hypothetical protein
MFPTVMCSLPSSHYSPFFPSPRRKSCKRIMVYHTASISSFLSSTLFLAVCLRPSFGRLDCESARPVIDTLLPICLAVAYHSETSSFRFKIKKSRSVIVLGHSLFLPEMFSASSLSCLFCSCTLLMNDLLSSAIDQEFFN